MLKTAKYVTSLPWDIYISTQSTKGVEGEGGGGLFLQQQNVTTLY